MSKKFTIATNYDDWEGLYVDGVLFTEGHKLSADDIFAALGIEFSEVDAGDYLEQHGTLPKSINALEQL